MTDEVPGGGVSNDDQSGGEESDTDQPGVDESDTDQSGVDDSDTDQSGDGVPGIDPGHLQARIDAGEQVRVLDLRNLDEVEQWGLTGPAVTVTQKPYNRFVQARVTDDLASFVDDVDGEGPITVVCARGEASAEVATTLDEAGYDAQNLTGGTEAWARLLQATELDRAVPEEATLVQYRRPSSGCLGYLVAADGVGAVVDPLRAFGERYVRDARERDVSIEYVVDTHVHADHVSGLRALADAADAVPILPETAVQRGVSYEVETLGDGERLDVGPLPLEAVHAPGHTTGMTAFSVGDTLLTGDSLFVDGVARPDLERSEDAAAFARDLYHTLTERFAQFPDQTVVAPGHHGEGATPGDSGEFTARLGNCWTLPVFDMSEAAFVAHLTEQTPPRPANHERIVAINLGHESVSDSDAFELELGPNNCAAGSGEATGSAGRNEPDQ